jgi:hypothetical protein
MQAADLFKNVDVKKIALDEQAKLFLVTRQFDKSQDAYRQIFASKQYTGDQLALADWIADYLSIAIRVKKDFAGAKATLTQLKSRTDLPMYMQSDIQAWIKEVDQLSKRKDMKATLPNIRTLMNEAKSIVQFPADREALIHYLLASSLLHEYILTTPKGKDAAEAYFLLGMTESMSARSYWLSQNEYYFETAIRMDPSSTYAKRAFKQLEENTLFEYSGSAGTYIPDEVQKHMNELRDLINSSKGH